MQTSEDILLAKVVKRGMEIHETSYDHAASNQADVDARQRQAEDTLTSHPYYVDYAQFYTKSMEEACLEAATELDSKALGYPAYLLCTYAWNDVDMWATEVLESARHTAERTVKPGPHTGTLSRAEVKSAVAQVVQSRRK